MVVQAPDNKVISFPESMDEAAVNAAMAKEYPAPKAEAPESMIHSVGRQVLHGTATTASGFNKGFADVMGLPVDLVNAGLKKLGMGSDNPAGGSAALNKIMPSPIKPEGYAENTANAIGEQAGALLPSMVIPGSSIAGLAKTAIGAGIGSGAARTFAPNSPYADMAAQVIGGTAPSLAKGAVRLLRPSFEHSMMERAMKPSTTLSEAERGRRVETALNEGTKVNKAGVEKATKIGKDINTEVQGRIDSYMANGNTAPINAPTATAFQVDRKAVTIPAEQMAATELPKLALPEKPTRDVNKVLSEFNRNHPFQFSVRDAQDFKQSLNKELDDFYKAVNASPDKTAALSKAWTNRTKTKIADGLRAEISDILPELAGLNAREASVIQMRKSLERAVNRVSQHDLWSLKGVIAMGLNPKLAFMNLMLNNPNVQSSMAVAMRAARKSPLNKAGMIAETVKQVAEPPEEKKADKRFSIKGD